MAKPTLPKGTRDFLPKEVLKRKYIFNTIETVFKKYGYLPIETPTMEALDTLTGKYGEEGDKLLFKVLNNGDYLDKADPIALSKKDSNALTSSISKRGLRYDLTVPFARFVVMYQNDISMPFKRYQIQPVWRADRPQKGRYQEFYQCDVDVVGSNSLMYEAELISIYHEVFNKLNLGVKIKINNRKVLFGMAENAGIADQFIMMTTAIDKLDKIGIDGVIKEMYDRNINEEAIGKIVDMLAITNLDELDGMMSNSIEGKKGIQELKEVYQYLDGSDVNNLEFDITLARGLSYYTGCIFEVKIDGTQHPKVSMGSIGGGGRYDNLTSSFGLNGVSGVGVSFGAERIYDVMLELDLFPNGIEKGVDILFCSFDEATHLFAFQLVTKLRKNNIAADIYPDPGKLKKQLKYADDLGIKLVSIIGQEEMESGFLTVKNLESGDQRKLSLDELIKELKD